MPSPFPGMDPYIESWIWGSFHGSMCQAVHDQLNPKLPNRFIASTDLCVWRVDPSERLLLDEPDVVVAKKFQAPSGPAVVTIAAPITTVLPGVGRKQRFVKIIDSEMRRVVTVIEILSPSNKMTGADGQAYRMKREEYFANGISLIEVDFLRSGQRPPLGNPAPPIVDYYVLVARGWERDRLGIWPISVRDTLPLIPIPLDEDVADATLDLRACLDQVYDLGRYAEQLEYSKPPRLPLREPDATWTRELLAKHRPSAAE